MIQDIEPHTFSNTYIPTAPSDNAQVVVFDNKRLLAQATDDGRSMVLPCARDVWGDGANDSHAPVFLFSIDDQPYYLAFSNRLDAPSPQIGGFSWHLASAFRTAEPFYLRMAVSTATQLASWYDTNRICGRCGHPMLRNEKERAITCPNCKNTVYPRINPAVIVAVRNDDDLLMIRYRDHYGYRERALIAGFCEIGETAEQTVSREVMEEAGVRVKNVRYVGSQPWGFASDLLLGFTCDLDGDATLHFDNNELAFAEWVPRSEIFEQNDQVSLTRAMVLAFKRGEL